MVNFIKSFHPGNYFYPMLLIGPALWTSFSINECINNLTQVYFDDRLNWDKPTVTCVQTMTDYVSSNALLTLPSNMPIQVLLISYCTSNTYVTEICVTFFRFLRPFSRLPKRLKEKYQWTTNASLAYHAKRIWLSFANDQMKWSNGKWNLYTYLFCVICGIKILEGFIVTMH